MIAQTPNTPYYAVIFTSRRTTEDQGYAQMAQQMETLAATMDGYLGIESAREGLGITVSYWRDLESIKKWKEQTDHLMAQQLGRKQWYSQYKVRISKVERDYGFGL